MSDYEAFVHELIGYIFKVQDKDDDNLSAEIICRKLYKYGLIENVNHEWRMKYRPKHRWPATVHNGRADKEDWQSYTIDRKTEPNNSEKPNNCEDWHGDCKTCEWYDGTSRYIPCCDYEPKDEATISKMEQVDKDINVRSKDCTTCRHAGEVYEDPCELCYRHSHYEPKDEATISKMEQVEDEPQTERSE